MQKFKHIFKGEFFGTEAEWNEFCKTLARAELFYKKECPIVSLGLWKKTPQQENTQRNADYKYLKSGF